MKNLIILIVLGIALSGAGCKKMKSWFGKKDAKQSAYVVSLENKIKADSLKHAQEIEQIKNESQALLDSLQNNCGKKPTGGNYAFYVITGSFKSQQFAASYQKKMKDMGFEAEIIDGPSDFNLVSVNASNSLGESKAALVNVKSLVTENAWIYARN